MSDQITYDDKADLIVDTTIDDMFKVSASDMNEIKSVVNANAQEMETNKAEVQDDIAVINNNINDLNNNKLDKNEVLNEASTETDKTYSANYMNDKIFTAFGNGTWTKNTAYVGNTGYMNCYKNNRLCYLNGNFRIDTVPTTKNEILISNLPHPRTRVTTIAMVETTPVRLYIDTDGTLRTDSTNYITGWVNFSCMYVL